MTTMVFIQTINKQRQGPLRAGGNAERVALRLPLRSYALKNPIISR